MNAPDRFLLPDIQSAADFRQIAIHRVGVKGLRYPVRVAGADGRVRTGPANGTRVSSGARDRRQLRRQGPSSVRGSLGRPSTRSPMMLRCTWLVPA